MHFIKGPFFFIIVSLSIYISCPSLRDTTYSKITLQNEIFMLQTPHGQSNSHPASDKPRSLLHKTQLKRGKCKIRRVVSSIHCHYV